MTRPNGIATNYAYDPLSRLQSVLHKLGANTVDGATYGYDNAGNRTSKTNQLNLAVSNFAYDNIYQLTGVMGATSESYTYDFVGNRLSSASVPTSTYNSSNELTGAGSATYTYDNNGNTITKTDASGTMAYTWDFENRLTSVQPPGQPLVTFKYDPFGRRIQKGSITYLYEGANLVEEADAGGNLTARYVFGPGIDEPVAAYRGTWKYYQADALGSITSLATLSSTVSDSFVYDSFGNLTSSTGAFTQPFRYTAREYDSEAGLYFYRARYYDATAGRFISEDPSGYNGGLNVYKYVRNNPLLFSDPLGLCPVIAKIKLWSTEEITPGKPVSPWVLHATHQENADGILPINNLQCVWARDLFATIQTTTTYLVIEECPRKPCWDGSGGHDLTFYTTKEHSTRIGTKREYAHTTVFTLTGFDEGQPDDTLLELWCHIKAPPPRD